MPDSAGPCRSPQAAAPRPPPRRGPGGEKSPEDKAREREELYDYFVDRFKHNLLVEREQMGHLIIDNP